MQALYRRLGGCESRWANPHCSPRKQFNVALARPGSGVCISRRTTAGEPRRLPIGDYFSSGDLIAIASTNPVSATVPEPTALRTKQSTPVVIDYVSDTICPWCYIGARRLEAAMNLLMPSVSMTVRWRAYELNPDMPPRGLDRKTYRSRKFGTWERSLELDAQVAAAGAEEGIVFRHHLIDRTPNTVASHVLVQLAGEIGDQPRVNEALFRAYFSDGRDVGDAETLVSIGVEQGLEEAAVRDALQDEDRRARVRCQAEGYRRAGLQGVPTLVFNGLVLSSGAAPAVHLAALLKAATTDQRAIENARLRHGSPQ